ncbi:hypothetical protein E3Q00_00480 [Wallemia mellicola]|nr:hypothetical protein E3Q00_00480 [Wallemia mellicola]
MPAKTKRYKGPLDLKRWHWYTFLTWFVALIFPPFGALDFLITFILTLLGWIPGQIYNFYIQNIRDNRTKERTPQFAIRYKLVDVDKYRKRQQRNAWRQRYEVGGIDSEGIFDSRSSVSSDKSATYFDLPFNTGSGPINSQNSSFVDDIQQTSRSTNRNKGSLFKRTFRKRKDPNHKKDRWERTRISREQSHMMVPDSLDELEAPEEPIGMYNTAHNTHDKVSIRDTALSTDLRHE